MLTQEELKSQIEYDPETGFFRWRITTPLKRTYSWFSGSRNSFGHYDIKVNGQLHKAHRLAWLYTYGEWPKEIDHINRDPGDNRITNLRLANRSQNIINSGLRKDNSSGQTGVEFIPTRNKPYRARIARGRVVVRKSFYSKEEAINWRREMETTLYDEFAP